MNNKEKEFIERYGHNFNCRCIRWSRNRVLVLPVRCTCNSDTMTRDKAFDQAESKFGKMSANNHAEIVAYIKGVEK